MYNGNPAPNYITTTANTITLVPNNFPSSNIKVATIFNDKELVYSTSIVNMTSYDPNYAIIGANTLCSTATYSINNLPSGTTIAS
ncbi:MAG: hypothetical protein COC22_06155 [Flavobacteriaceae bacterium]|nr:MAG: hypothetical protein COC22_06155 [Flavobacteriaceae bacterium]